MFSLSSSKHKAVFWLTIMVLSLFWIMDDTSAKNLPVEGKSTLPHVEIKHGSNLVADANEASEKQVPVLMFFSMKHCGYCIEVEEDYLKPMLRNAAYDGKVIIRKIKIDSSDSMKDFNGKERDVEEFSDDYNVSMVPTVILVDSYGNKLAPPIVGIANAHFYSHDLDRAIEESRQKIRTLAKH